MLLRFHCDNHLANHRNLSERWNMNTSSNPKAEWLDEQRINACNPVKARSQKPLLEHRFIKKFLRLIAGIDSDSLSKFPSIPDANVAES
ncbi:hypothetical protein CDAR_165531 [Caerostris darwini]|uniref:Uncharacterized protein n=1 Tax=Caerostris darwini TaxID=1538125 RepID=A0AAV4W9Z1_9ARAC|nr:hypothetical protein CDAR_165531 [Caerostris darwini]